MAGTRREMMACVAGAVVGAVAGAAFRTTSASAERGQMLLRPPGARNEREFLAACIRCGQCIQACPFETLKMAGLEHGISHGSPYLVPQDVPCYLCQEYDEPLCIAVCPTQALRPVDDLREIRVGTAVIDQDICLPFNGALCRACWHACPFPDEAIRLDMRLRPVVVEDGCVGCGLCEHACPTEPRSIAVRPPSASGRRKPAGSSTSHEPAVSPNPPGS